MVIFIFLAVAIYYRTRYNTQFYFFESKNQATKDDVYFKKDVLRRSAHTSMLQKLQAQTNIPWERKI